MSDRRRRESRPKRSTVDRDQQQFDEEVARCAALPPGPLCSMCYEKSVPEPGDICADCAATWGGR